MEIKRMILFARRGWVSFYTLRGRRGMFFIKTGGVLRDRQGILKMGRGLSGILAGYFNCWGPNLPLSGIWNNFR
jgi:hypothetical protein